MDRLRDYSLLRLTTSASASEAFGGLPRKPNAAPSRVDRLEKLRHERAKARKPDASTGATGLHVLPLALGDDPRGRPVVLPCAIDGRPGGELGEKLPMLAACDLDEEIG
jgi:hypothetical protein